MTEQEILTAIARIVAPQLGADSLDILELVMAIEEEFDVDFSDEEVEHLATVRDLFELINTKVGNPPAAKE